MIVNFKMIVVFAEEPAWNRYTYALIYGTDVHEFGRTLSHHYLKQLLFY